MVTTVGSNVHPWYRAVREWRVRGVAQLPKPIEYSDPVQGAVKYDPKIMLLEAESVGKVLWFPYWMATDKTKGTMKWGQRPPVLEERVFLHLIKDGIKNGLFSQSFLKRLDSEIQSALK